MSKIGKYSALKEFFLHEQRDFIAMTFTQIEKILGQPLPDSARKYQPYWANQTQGIHPFCDSWMEAGYESKDLNLSAETVNFVKISSLGKRRTSSVSRPAPVHRSPTISAEKAAQSIWDYFSETLVDPNARFLSWEHCYGAFSENRQNKDATTVDFLALHLGFYLASWGMYRGSTFLLQKDYKVHIPTVQILLEPQYAPLWGISAEALCLEENLRLLEELSQRISLAYRNTPNAFPGRENHVTDTLVTKILLGTLGCVPAYDTYYTKMVKKYSVSGENYNSSSVLEIAHFYIRHKDIFEPLREKISRGRVSYPPMKLMDMCFWQLGDAEQ